MSNETSLTEDEVITLVVPGDSNDAYERFQHFPYFHDFVTTYADMYDYSVERILGDDYTWTLAMDPKYLGFMTREEVSKAQKMYRDQVRRS